MKDKKTTATSTEIGYCKPPKDHQFKPGQSGNPAGRPKGKSSSSIREAIAAGLRKTVTVKVGGRPTRMTQADLIATQLLLKASSADIRALQLVMDSESQVPESNVMSEITGAAERLGQRLRLLSLRERKRRVKSGSKSDAEQKADATSGEGSR